MTTTEQKLFALAAAAGKAAKEGDTDRALNTINLMAHILDEPSEAKAKEILSELKKTEPEIKGVHNYLGGTHIGIGGQEPQPPDDAIDITHLPHEQSLFCLVVNLGGHLRALLQEDDEEEQKKIGRNVTWLINMISKWVTKEDWDKAKKMMEKKPEEPDAFQNFLST